MHLSNKLLIGLLIGGTLGAEVDENEEVRTPGYLGQFVNEIICSPLNIFLLFSILFLIYKITRGSDESSSYTPPPPPLPQMKKRDITLKELREYDGTHPSGRILVAVNGKVFDVTRGKSIYGPDGPYGSFAGHDASRALAMFQTEMVKEDYDDLSDLDKAQMESVREWEEQLAEKYDFVGKLLRPGEEASNYSDEEEKDDEHEITTTDK